MDTEKWPQDNGMVKPMEQMNPMINSNNMNNGCSSKPGVEKRTTKGPQNNKEHALNCPRCNSTNTKFCYYNNYSLTQPRYFCKTCRRYWTEGGSLRNVPIGGGSRKNKRSITISSSSSAAPPAAATIVTNASSFLGGPDLSPPSLSLLSSHQNARTQDLNLGTYLGLSQFAQPGPEIGPNNGAAHHHHNGSTPSTSSSNANSSGLPAALELLRTGIASRGVNSFVPLQMPMMAPSHSVTYNNAGISFPGPTLNFNPMGINGGLHGVQENGTGRALFPFGELKQIPTSTGIDQVTKGQWNSNNGMLGGGSW